MDFGLGLVIGMIIGLLINWVVEPILKRTVTPVKPQPPPTPVSNPVIKVIIRDQDDLEQINGIGPVFSKRLKEAGIFTYQQLANASAPKIQKVVAAEEWQNIDVDAWINEARRLQDVHKEH